jgi:drug/metabolite transporter (DMT)-like permease
MWWPLTVVRICGVVLVAAGIAYGIWRQSGTSRERVAKTLGLDRFRASGRTLVGALPLFAISGAGDMGGNAFFVLARGADAFSVAVVLASLYPVVTTLLAAFVLHERLRPLQVAGVALATLSVPLLR